MSAACMCVECLGDDQLPIVKRYLYALVLCDTAWYTDTGGRQSCVVYM